MQVAAATGRRRRSCSCGGGGGVRLAAVVVVAVVVLQLQAAAVAEGQLANNYYAGKCGDNSSSVDVEGVIRGVVKARLAWDPRMVAGLLHMFFHDCFVAGCDASILLDGANTEKTAPANNAIFGYDHIDDIKSAVEAVCPGVVSCADIVVAATRDAVSMSGGPNYQVQLGRRDGMSSQSWMANDLPRPDVEIAAAIDMFAKKGLSSFDMAILMGGHSVGVTHCSVINDRLYNFNGTGEADPSMDPTYAWVLRTYACPQGQSFDNIVYLDSPNSILTVDSSIYTQILNHRGALAVDQKLGESPATAWMVQFLGTSDYFSYMFGNALNKLAGVGVLTGAAGEIRSNCRVTN